VRAPGAGYRWPVAGRECPECGRQLKYGVDHLRLMHDKPLIAVPRWDCERCGWSLTFDPQEQRSPGSRE
jgi:rubredoxin